MKRFWTDVSIEARGDDFAILLDGRIVKTPLRADLTLSNMAMARAVAQEWEDCGEDIDPAGMPMTGYANAAIDRVAADRQDFVDAIAAFGESDLFCYRAESPQKLVDRQAAIWDVWLDWAAQRYDVGFNVVQGIVHRAQPEETIRALKAAVAAMDDFQLSALSRLTHLSGSLVAPLALAEGRTVADKIWPDLIVDELWQEEQWGADDFAIKNRHDREADFTDAARFLGLTLCWRGQ